jgi:hypothetical protein
LTPSERIRIEVVVRARDLGRATDLLDVRRREREPEPLCDEELTRRALDAGRRLPTPSS